MKALLFLSMLFPFVCFARPRDAEVERIAAEKSGKLSEVVAEMKSRRIKRTLYKVTDQDCEFNITGEPTSAHNGVCISNYHLNDGTTSIACWSEGLFPEGPRRFTTGRGNCKPPIVSGVTECAFTSHQPAPFHEFKGKCQEGFTNLCVVPENTLKFGDPLITRASADCNPGRNVMVQKDQQEEEKNDKKTEENNEKKSSKVKA